MCGFAVVVGVVAGVAVLFASILLDTPPWPAGPKLAQAASLLIAFGFTGEFFQLKRAYTDLEAAATRTLETCALANESALDAEAVHAAVTEYDCTLAKSPPIPGVVYRIQRPGLEQEWLAIEGGTAKKDKVA